MPTLTVSDHRPPTITRVTIATPCGATPAGTTNPSNRPRTRFLLRDFLFILLLNFTIINGLKFRYSFWSTDYPTRENTICTIAGNLNGTDTTIHRRTPAVPISRAIIPIMITIFDVINFI